MKTKQSKTKPNSSWGEGQTLQIGMQGGKAGNRRDSGWRPDFNDPSNNFPVNKELASDQ